MQSTPPRRGCKKNQLALGIGVRLVRNVDIIKVMKAAGFDWLFLDLEHGSMSIETACEIAIGGAGFRHRADRARALRRARHGDARARRRRARHRHPPRRHRRGGARDRRPAALSAARPSLGRRRPGAVRLRADEARRHDQAQQRQHPDHRDDRDAQGGAQRRGDRGRARHRLPAGRLERSVDGDGHPRRERASRRSRRPSTRSSPPARSTASGRAWAAPTARSCCSSTSARA